MNKFSLALTLLLCSCAVKPPVPDSPAKTSPPVAAESSGNAPESTIFKSQRVITPSEIIEKDKLRISYSLKVAPDETGYLVQVSMVFRNKKEQSLILRPKITLSDGADAKLKAYSKKSFLRLASSKSGDPAAAEKIKWANTYWMKDHFTIPGNGIEIGELAFHCTRLSYPMKLKVSSAHQDFVFTISEAQQVASKQP